MAQQRIYGIDVCIPSFWHALLPHVLSFLQRIPFTANSTLSTMMLSGSLAVVVSLLGLTVASPFEVLDKRQTEPGSARTVLTVQLDELRPRDSNQSYFGVNVSVGYVEFQ